MPIIMMSIIIVANMVNSTINNWLSIRHIANHFTKLLDWVLIVLLGEGDQCPFPRWQLEAYKG